MTYLYIILSLMLAILLGMRLSDLMDGSYGPRSDIRIHKEEIKILNKEI